LDKRCNIPGDSFQSWAVVRRLRHECSDEAQLQF